MIVTCEKCGERWSTGGDPGLPATHPDETCLYRQTERQMQKRGWRSVKKNLAKYESAGVPIEYAPIGMTISGATYVLNYGYWAPGWVIELDQQLVAALGISTIPEKNPAGAGKMAGTPAGAPVYRGLTRQQRDASRRKILGFAQSEPDLPAAFIAALRLNLGAGLLFIGQMYEKKYGELLHYMVSGLDTKIQEVLE